MFFRRHPSLRTIIIVLDRDRQKKKKKKKKKKSEKMKRLFGVKKTVEAPSLEETTGKVIIKQH